jgi:hypothetical protein
MQGRTGAEIKQSRKQQRTCDAEEQLCNRGARAKQECRAEPRASVACLTASSSSEAAIAGTIRVAALSANTPAAAKSRRVKFMAILPL